MNMNKNIPTFLSSIVILTCGIFLIVFHDRTALMENMIIALGILFLIPSIIAIIGIFLFSNRNNNTGTTISYYGLASAIGGACFGLLLIIEPEIFVGILAYLFAVILILAGVFHMIILFASMKSVRKPLWFFILPSLITIAGLVILFTDIRTIESIVILITGISFVCFAVNSIIELIAIKIAYRKGIITP